MVPRITISTSFVIQPCPARRPNRVSPYLRHMSVVFAETLADYQRRKDTPATLERALNITKPYQLLNRDEAKEFAELHDLRPGPKAKPKELFQKATDLFGLTDVYFNGDRTLALTGISTYCGPLCGGYQWKVFEKTNRGWEERRWVGCRTIASAARPKPTPLMSS